ncbi:TIGR03085 family metal-binding protein [Pseudonocardia sp. RS11V-5]|uniref:TIGR03085 family metal-binding protein n=1 Tax=Pseudonocardia terrae TaxID=2905831 RepID=UPI001E587D01|nr:TIGR03085 family metal-binding protein [Pseudonocardia terrae]MCE3555068.1 TIGR03085 family metal-binding protein [Pseudonocardia terrae]
MSLATDERAALSDTLEKLGPDRPTLCEGWTTRDLLAHLLVRERQPWAAPGILVPALHPITQKGMAGYADSAWESMIGELRAGAPPWSPYRIGKVDEVANGAEFFVHHEDARRGAPGWEPRPSDPGRDEQLWALATRMGRLLLRRSPVGVVLRRPEGAAHVVRTGPGLVTLVGDPGEIVLHLFGRDASRVEVEGSVTDVAAYESVGRGL